jgi:hypothetical protein
MLKKLLFGLFCLTIGVGIERLAALQYIEEVNAQSANLRLENIKLQMFIGNIKPCHLLHLLNGQRFI